jgi:activator of 2-hydroxyglutaryl-CoA dehydratase
MFFYQATGVYKQKMIAAGCDAGSLTAKAFIMNEKGQLVAAFGASLIVQGKNIRKKRGNS